MKKYKILTMCAGGNVRSVGLKYLLKYKYGHDALACGQDANPPETREMLCKWADYIIVMTENYFKEIPTEYHNKTLIYEVGPDTYGYAFNPELLTKADSLIVQHGLFNK
jgi:predicted protein tyrosine phosphatase